MASGVGCFRFSFVQFCTIKKNEHDHFPKKKNIHQHTTSPESGSKDSTRSIQDVDGVEVTQSVQDEVSHLLMSPSSLQPLY